MIKNIRGCVKTNFFHTGIGYQNNDLFLFSAAELCSISSYHITFCGPTKRKGNENEILAGQPSRRENLSVLGTESRDLIAFDVMFSLKPLCSQSGF